MMRIIYASRSRVPAADAEAAVDSIVETSRRRNAREGISGALIFTGGDFAQVLEGPEPGVDRLMSAIERDPRHDSVRVLKRETVENGDFDRWRMAYAGASRWVHSHIERARAGADGCDHEVDVRELLRLLFTMADEARRDEAGR